MASMAHLVNIDDIECNWTSNFRVNILWNIIQICSIL